MFENIKFGLHAELLHNRGYHWIWGVGPRDERPEWINLSWWNEREPSDFGTHEFIRFCRNLGAEPHLVVNVEGRGATAEEPAAWVEYANGDTTTKYGALRATHGSPEPFGVKTWEIGNEIWGDWVRGHSGTPGCRCPGSTPWSRRCTARG